MENYSLKKVSRPMRVFREAQRERKYIFLLFKSFGAHCQVK
jgi:hypothetical protein